jgi:site-specific DNA-adenine methylase
MKYMGGKSRQARALVDAMARIWPASPEARIVEPFMGGCNVTADLGRRFPHEIKASDINPSVVLMWQAIVAGWAPPTAVITREEWAAWKGAPDSTLRGWYGVAGSMNGAFFRAYGVEYDFKAKPGNLTRSRDQYHNYLAETARAVEKQKQALTRCSFGCFDYADTETRPGDLVYVDPPYAGVSGYGAPFDSARLWAWCDQISRAGCFVFVSEYTAPPGWVAVYTLEKAVTARAKNGGARYATDNLYHRVPA